MFKKVMGYIISFAIIMGCLWLGNGIQALLSLSIPGSIFGMLILFALLASGLIKVQWISPSAHAFIRYMIILFVPISVGLMDHFPMLIDNALSIFASSVGATTIVLVVLALSLQKILSSHDKVEKTSKSKES
ncbi:CidA/LrgA family protein [Vibrio sp. S11_S32]|uniref:CidA/LrgA family protein n=1 Tax=Vibrio sp. S11_S32 TaxID=2720225 RepID=UPI00168063E9|nr:CidA/LrgA family protein [Vibrio sp. S11_S32]